MSSRRTIHWSAVAWRPDEGIDEELTEVGDFSVGVADIVISGDLAIRVEGGRSPEPPGEDDEKPGGFKPDTVGPGDERST